MGVFQATSFDIHRVTGQAITFASFLLLLLSLAGVLGRSAIGFSILLAVLMFVQSLLVHLHNPFVAALHPLNGLAIMGVTASLVIIGLKKVRSEQNH